MSDTAVARHLANRADLVARLDALETVWASEDARIAEDRKALREKYLNGLRDVDAVIVRDGGVVPVAEAPVVEATPEPAPVFVPEPALEISHEEPAA